ncbi:MAG: STAS domain-containing protein [Planctomycetota bacterium]|nr:STAS domain-containing protein [Planctomycetota bacterium]MCX8039770.1 STAS domain-containing protein [Planctomycetota bacterium]MDW8373150.1 STAS domain-containing protein [Planctomycetota bacterium]
MIVEHQPAGVCRIRITIEPVFSREEFLPQILGALQEDERTLLLDLQLVAVLHTPALANLVSLHVALAKRGIELVLTGLNDANRRILAITKLDRLFSIR